MDNHSLHDFIAKTGLALLVITKYFHMAAWNYGLAYPQKPRKRQTNKNLFPGQTTPALARHPPLSSGNILLSFVAT